MRVAVIGGGISGLSTALRLQQEGHEAVVLETRDRTGGNIRTEEWMGCRVEWGPNGFLDNEPATLTLIEQLGLKDRMQHARSAAAKRYIFRAGKLRALPGSPRQFLTSDCLPLGARLRVLLEPWSKPPPKGPESVRAFAARHLGRGAADILVDAFVTGIFAGDPARLELKSALPKLHKLEAEYGSLIKGAKGRGFGPPGVLTSFDEGLEVLVAALAERVDVRLGADVSTLEQDGFDKVICTVPAPRAAELASGELQGLLQKIPTAPLAVVATLFDDSIDVEDAFGFLAPHGQGLRIMGTLYDSSIFPGRAPQGKRLFRSMVGGRRDPEAISLSDDELTELVQRDLHQAWGRVPEPLGVKVIRHPLGIAQYELGHAEVVAQLEAACPPWLRLSGSSYRGISINLCIKEALDWAP